MASEEMIFAPQIKHFGCQGNQSNSEVCTKIICLVEDYAINISEELLPKYLQREAINANLHFSHYTSMETLSCHSNGNTNIIL